MDHQIKRQSSQNFNFSSLSGPKHQHYAHSVSGGAGGYGTRISRFYHSQLGPHFGGGYKYTFSSRSSGNTSGDLNIRTSGDLNIGNEKLAMQHLNDRLASYLETVRKLEKANNVLEIKIRETIEKRGPLEGRDYSKYYATIADLRAKIFNMVKGNAHLAISLDNARLASDDFRAKMEYELSMRQAVEADVARLRKFLDDTNVVRMNLEAEIESMKEELITLKKNHEREVAELQAQIAQAGVQVDVDAPKGQDLTRIMEEIRAKYEKIALKNQEEFKAWHESQITEVQVKVTESSTALKDASSLMTETRRRYQALEIELQSAHSLKAALEAALRDTEMSYNVELEKYNAIILRLQEELTQIRSNIQQNTHEYDLLLNIKVKLEAEIAEYRRLLDGGGELMLEDALNSAKVQNVITVTQTLVDGKVVSETKDVKSSENLAIS
ncbi:keratin, type I cytoskeletal 18-like [Archocentrus centrarchus]|uniref:keratin, type I cytoskeletal 18-like n=1 Tax=Archocentrus centrarchus TaxID=63155 RepID=UPI0011EA1181|nr:keratin, type I cytoskeletal 18-like [Archocentrus centrarchus]